MVVVSFKPQMPEIYNAFFSASESNKQNLRDRALDLLFFFRYNHITSLKPPVACTRGEFALQVRGNFCGRIIIIIYYYHFI